MPSGTARTPPLITPRNPPPKIKEEAAGQQCSRGRQLRMGNGGHHPRQWQGGGTRWAREKRGTKNPSHSKKEAAATSPSRHAFDSTPWSRISTALAAKLGSLALSMGDTSAQDAQQAIRLERHNQELPTRSPRVPGRCLGDTSWNSRVASRPQSKELPGGGWQRRHHLGAPGKISNIIRRALDSGYVRSSLSCLCSSLLVPYLPPAAILGPNFASCVPASEDFWRTLRTSEWVALL